MSANPALSDETMAGSATLSKLKTLASKMRDPTLYSTLNPSVSLSHAPLLSHADIAAISQFGQLLNERDGISFFELAQSGLVEALLEYLTAEDGGIDVTGSTDSNPTSPSGAGKGLKDDGSAGTERRIYRLRAFCHIFLGAPAPQPPPTAAGTPSTGKKATRSASRGVPPPVPPAAAEPPNAGGGGEKLLGLLVSKLHEALNMIERFPLLLTEGNSSDTSSAGLKALTQPFKLRLTRAPGTSTTLKEYASSRAHRAVGVCCGD